MVVSGYLLAVQGQTYYGSHIVLSAMHSILNELVQSLILSIKVVCSLVEPIHVLLTL